MEVHKHPHHVTHTKKWGEYLLEFFMLFLAVFLGFVAENIRESSVEKHREKEYIKSFAEDLEIDITRIDVTRTLFDKMVESSDTLLALIKTPDSNTNHIYKLSIYSLSQYAFLRNDRTIQQLKNQGGFRIISNNELSDKILSYDASIDLLNTSLHNYGLKMLEKEEDMSSKIFDPTILQKAITPNLSSIGEITGNPPLLSTDKTLLNQYCYFVQKRMIYLMAEKNTLDIIQRNADSLVEYLVRKYSFVKDVEVNNISYLKRKLEQTLEKQGKVAFIEQYKTFRDVSEKVSWNGESGLLNTIGYDLLRKKKCEQAIIVFQLQTQVFQDDWNAWDGLGDGYAATKDTAAAIISYEKAIRLNAGDNSSVKKIKKLERE